MADKDFKVKNKLFVNGLSHNSGVILATNNNLDSHTTVPTQYGGTGTTTSPNAGQFLYSTSGSTYAPVTLSNYLNYQIIQSNATAISSRQIINFYGADLVDDLANNRTNVTINLAATGLDGGRVDSISMYDGGEPSTNSFMYIIEGGTP